MKKNIYAYGYTTNEEDTHDLQVYFNFEDNQVIFKANEEIFKTSALSNYDLTNEEIQLIKNNTHDYDLIDLFVGEILREFDTYQDKQKEKEETIKQLIDLIGEDELINDHNFYSKEMARYDYSIDPSKELEQFLRGSDTWGIIWESGDITPITLELLESIKKYYNLENNKEGQKMTEELRNRFAVVEENGNGDQWVNLFDTYDKALKYAEEQYRVLSASTWSGTEQDGGVMIITDFEMREDDSNEIDFFKGFNDLWRDGRTAKELELITITNYEYECTLNDIRVEAYRAEGHEDVNVHDLYDSGFLDEMFSFPNSKSFVRWEYNEHLEELKEIAESYAKAYTDSEEE